MLHRHPTCFRDAEWHRLHGRRTRVLRSRARRGAVRVDLLARDAHLVLCEARLRLVSVVPGCSGLRRRIAWSRGGESAWLGLVLCDAWRRAHWGLVVTYNAPCSAVCGILLLLALPEKEEYDAENDCT
jgi:hypothetical protein